MGKNVLGILALLGISVVLILVADLWILDLFTRVYVSVQIVVGLFVFGVMWWQKGWYTHTNTAASILTIIGVFGTFLGIYIGLQGFDIGNIEASIPDLLGALKLAFLTSLVGIGSALCLKGIVSPLVQVLEKRDDRDPLEEAIEKFVLALKDVETSGESHLSAKLDGLTKVIKNEDNDTGTVLGGIDDIRTALIGEAERTIPMQLQDLSKVLSESRLNVIETSLSDEEGNLLTELRSVKNEISTKHDDLREEFQKFSENVAESVAKLATDELIEALKTVIEEFNAKIQEQFGENFKHLNEAVGRTVEWQEQYRQQMDRLAEEFRIAAQSVEQSRAALSSASQSLMTIEDQSESLVFIAEKLDPILHTLNDQLEAFSELRQRAHEAFPLIESRLNDLTVSFSGTVRTAITDSYASMETQRDALATQVDQLQRNSNETTERITELTTNFSDAIRASIAESQESMAQQREALTTQSQQLQTTIIASNQQIQQTVDDIRSRLDSVFERSASHIAQVTTGFTQNLTQQLQDTLKGQTQELSNIVERNREDIENHVNILHTALRKEVNTLNESLEEELTTSLQTLAGHFESLSNGFVNNYTQLVGPYTQVVTELQQLVDASRRGLR